MSAPTIPLIKNGITTRSLLTFVLNIIEMEISKSAIILEEFPRVKTKITDEL